MNPENFMEAEQLIIDRLIALTSAKAVLSSEDISDSRAQSQITPSIQVFLDHYQPSEEIANGAIIKMEQTWLVVIVVKNARSTKDIRESAGPILIQTLNAMLGWKPSNNLSAFKGAATYKPMVQLGFGYFPLSFKTQMVIEGKDA